MKNRSWRWLLGLGLAVTVSVSALAQDEHHHDGHHRGSKHKSDYRSAERGDLAHKVYRVTQADSVQKIKMKPAVDRASKRLAALRQNYAKQEKRVMDSLSLQLKPLLKEDQVKRLSDWNDKKQSK